MTSWAFEMETIMLGWYILVETRSVLLLTVFASMQHLGTLIAPFVGVMADRLGTRNVLCAMRAFYCLLATTLMTFTFLGLLTPIHVFVIAGLLGLVRPSDIGMRVALVGDTMPPAQLLGAMGIQRTTQDSAKVAGALTGAGLVAVLGMGAAYVVVASFYAISVLLTLKAGSRTASRTRTDAANAASAWRDLKAGLTYVWSTPRLLALMCLAFMLNLTAFPIFNGLLPYVAKEVYFTDQTGLGYMVAGAASGSLFASIVLSHLGGRFRAERLMIAGFIGWYAFLLVFANVPYHLPGIVLLFLAGVMQSVNQVPMATMLLRSTDERFRSRVQGIRMLAIYGNVPGLLIAGQLIPAIGYSFTASLYSVFGLAVGLWICVHWRAQLQEPRKAAALR